jgi:putative Ca2+/H+ antiporter (TMEM165/GDT1 family)
VEAFAGAIVLVATAEIGDKTQLLSLYLAARYRAPLAISAGIAVATLANHALAALLGTWAGGLLGAQALRWVVGVSFLAFGAWALWPDKLSAPAGIERQRLGVFILTVITFFIAEMGDKTQLATIALGAKYQAFAVVVLGTTIGMLIANVPIAYAGERLAKRIPVHLARRIAAALFAISGVATLVLG